MNKNKSLAPAVWHLGGSLVGGVVAGALVGVMVSWQYAPLAAWDVTAIIFLVWIFGALHGLNGEETSKLAIVEDPGRAVTDILLVFASIASLAAVGVLLSQASDSNGVTKIIQIGLATFSVIVSWVLVHSIYTLKYARMYYRGNDGVDFYSKALPRFSDFAYIAFTIGMTFQVSDNNFKTNEFRRTVLRHALLSYLFGTVILASVINFIVGLGK